MPYRNRRNNGYSRIPVQVRKTLVRLILEEKWTYAQAAKELKIKLSTSKLIVKRFRETGTFFDPYQKVGSRPQNAEESENYSNENEEEIPRVSTQNIDCCSYVLPTWQQMPYIGFPQYYQSQMLPALSFNCYSYPMFPTYSFSS